jgi:hypothetical protein
MIIVSQSQIMCCIGDDLIARPSAWLIIRLCARVYGMCHGQRAQRTRIRRAFNLLCFHLLQIGFDQLGIHGVHTLKTFFQRLVELASSAMGLVKQSEIDRFMFVSSWTWIERGTCMAILRSNEQGPFKALCLKCSAILTGSRRVALDLPAAGRKGGLFSHGLYIAGKATIHSRADRCESDDSRLFEKV